MPLSFWLFLITIIVATILAIASAVVEQKKYKLSFTYSDTIDSMIEKMGIDVELALTSDLPKGKEAVLDGKLMKVNKKIGYQQRTFDMAHEIAHRVLGDDGVVARDFHSFRSRSTQEQACDYVAAALLLPYDEVKEYISECNFFDLSSQQKMRHVNILAIRKNIYEEVVIRRMYEVKTLMDVSK